MTEDVRKYAAEQGIAESDTLESALRKGVSTVVASLRRGVSAPVGNPPWRTKRPSRRNFSRRRRSACVSTTQTKLHVVCHHLIPSAGAIKAGRLLLSEVRHSIRSTGNIRPSRTGGKVAGMNKSALRREHSLDRRKYFTGTVRAR